MPTDFDQRHVARIHRTANGRVGGFGLKDVGTTGLEEGTMAFDLLWRISERAKNHQKLTPEEKKFVGDVVPRELAEFPHLVLPTRVRHPAGFTISGRPVRTFLHAALLLSARNVLGPKYGQESEFYGVVEENLTFGIMRSHFHLGYPKGTHCCAQCTLAVYPVLKAGAIRWFDCKPLATSVRHLIETRQWRFSRSTNQKMIDWALQH